MRINRVILFLILLSAIFFSACQSNYQKRVQKGKHYLSNGAFEDAAAEFLVALKDKPSDPEINYLLGLSYAKMGKFDLCDKYFSKAYVLSPDYHQLIISHYYELGEQRKAIRDKDSAIKSFAKVLELDSSYDLGKYFFYLGDYYFDTGKYNDCINVYQKAVLEFPEDSKSREARFRIAKCYSELKNYQSSLAESDSFLQLYPQIDVSTQTEINWIRGQAAYNLAQKELDEKTRVIVTITIITPETISTKNVLDLAIASGFCVDCAYILYKERKNSVALEIIAFSLLLC